jgi:hypothetical protein
MNRSGISKHWRVAVVLALALSVSAPDAGATSCAAPPGSVEAAELADAVFVGEITAGGSEHHPLSCVEEWLREHLGLSRSWDCVTGFITFTVRERFKGSLGREVTLVSDGPLQFRERFAVGAQLLVYSTKDKRGNLEFNVCGRIMFLARADEDLKVLRARYPSG